MSIHVLRPGLLTTVQDYGRHGFQRVGLCPGGAMDPVALALANAAREALRIGDVVERMLGGVLEAVRTNDGKLAREIGRASCRERVLYRV